MRTVYQALNPIDAHLVKHALEDSDIPAFVLGEHLVGGMGELPALGLLGLAVADDQALYARELIDAYNAASPVAGDEPESFPDVLVC